MQKPEFLGIPLAQQAGRFISALGLVIVALTAASASAMAQTNSWIQLGGGKWEEASAWSLGVLPHRSQVVAITNAGKKVIEIDAGTIQGRPESLVVEQLAVSGQNTLLLRDAGTNAPFRLLPGTNIWNGLTLSQGGTLVNLDSRIVIGDSAAGLLRIAGGHVFQGGGIVEAPHTTYIHGGGHYHLTNGVFDARSVEIPGDGHLHQYGGTANISGTLRIIYGSYELSGGNLGAARLSLGDGAEFAQSGGTNRNSSLSLSMTSTGGSPVRYSMDGGSLYNSYVLVGFGATFNQNGSVHAITDTLKLEGAGRYYPPRPVYSATYTTSGFLSARSVELNDFSEFSTSGTSLIEESLQFVGGTDYIGRVILSGGILACSDVLNAGAVIDIRQTDGAFVISNLFSFSGYYAGVYDGQGARQARYSFEGGTLIAQNIDMAAEWIIGSSEQAGRITNPGFFKMAGTLRAGDADEQLGRFILASNGVIDLGGGKARLSFASSSAEGWDNEAILVVANWNGSPRGGGDDQLKFGNDPSGVSAAQMAQIRFIDPAGLSPGDYSTEILATGEVVPRVGPMIAHAQVGQNLILRWEGNLLLETSTNVAGPYMMVPNASQAHTNAMTSSPQRFFRLRPVNLAPE